MPLIGYASDSGAAGICQRGANCVNLYNLCFFFFFFFFGGGGGGSRVVLMLSRAT